MPVHVNGKKAVIGALALSLVFGSGYIAAPQAAYAETTTAMTTPFTDIAKGHWAEKHIAKLSLQGIIAGYRQASTGTYYFAPNKNVSREEAVLMVLGFAGLLNKVDPNVDYGFADGFVVSKFFKPYVALAFSEGLLDSSEIELAAQDTTVSWGTTPASREWVTKLAIKAIGKAELADSLGNTASAFADGGDIGSQYLGYVNAAVQLELVKGVTATAFQPKANVTRASLATILSFAQSQYEVEYAGQTTGIATSISDNLLTVYKDGQQTSYTLDDSTLYYTYLNTSPITKSGLLLYGDITVIAKNGVAKYVEVKGDTAHTTTISGTLGRIVTDEKKIYLWINNNPTPFAYDDSVVIEDTEGNPLKLSDLKTDSVISIVLDTFRASPLAIKIVSAPLSSLNAVKGLFYSTDGKLITIKDANGLTTKFLAEDVAVEIEGLKEPTMDDLLNETDQVELTLNEKEQVTKIKVVGRQVETLSDVKIASFVEDMKLLTVVDLDGKQPKVLYITDKTKVEYYGTPLTLAGSIDLLTQGLQVVISYTGDKVVSMKIVSEFTGKFVSIDTDNYEIKIKLDSGRIITIPYSNPYVEIPGSTTGQLSELKKDDLVTLELSPTQENAIKIKLHRSVEYQVLVIDYMNKKLRVKTATGTPFDLSIADVAITDKNGIAKNVGDVTVGSTIVASYIGAYPKAIQLQ